MRLRSKRRHRTNHGGISTKRLHPSNHGRFIGSHMIKAADLCFNGSNTLKIWFPLWQHPVRQVFRFILHISVKLIQKVKMLPRCVALHCSVVAVCRCVVAVLCRVVFSWEKQQRVLCCVAEVSPKCRDSVLQCLGMRIPSFSLPLACWFGIQMFKKASVLSELLRKKWKKSWMTTFNQSKISTTFQHWRMKSVWFLPTAQTDVWIKWWEEMHVCLCWTCQIREQISASCGNESE